ncbi:MAG: RibD family protein [Acidobacteria bacterium]|nr:RibD family protein [Acidobacteriota bacterium]
MHRPRVILCYAMSTDGKISAADGTGSAFTSRADRDRLDGVRAGVDLIVVGGETVRREDPPFALRSGPAVAARLARGAAAHPDVCILTRNTHLPPGLRAFRQAGQRVLVAGPGPGAPLPSGTAARLERLVTPDPFDPSALLADPALAGCNRVLVEGGGRVNAFFVEAGLVDEVLVTLSPVLLGGAEAPTPVAGVGLSLAGRFRLDLVSCEAAGSELFLHYRSRRVGQRGGEGGG